MTEKSIFPIVMSTALDISNCSVAVLTFVVPQPVNDIMQQHIMAAMVILRVGELQSLCINALTHLLRINPPVTKSYEILGKHWLRSAHTPY